MSKAETILKKYIDTLDEGHVYWVLEALKEQADKAYQQAIWDYHDKGFNKEKYLQDISNNPTP
jgi:protein-disulfide isomerase